MFDFVRATSPSQLLTTLKMALQMDIPKVSYYASVTWVNFGLANRTENTIAKPRLKISSTNRKIIFKVNVVSPG